jgi:ABC-type Mn2+/Zn2+ transport system ATPase subunit
MDEPFTGVDAATQETTLALLDQLKTQQVTALVSTHDLNMAVQRFEHVLLLNQRLIAYGPAREVLSPDAIQQAFRGQVLFLGDVAVVDDCCPPPEG